MTRLENRLPPPILMLMIAGLMLAVARSTNPAPVSPTVSGIAALVLFVAAGAFGFPAISAFRRARTTINPVRIKAASALVTSGIFAMSRNPMYVALTLLLCALAVFLAAPWTALGPVSFAIFIDRYQIRPEEAGCWPSSGGNTTTTEKPCVGGSEINSPPGRMQPGFSHEPIGWCPRRRRSYLRPLKNPRSISAASLSRIPPYTSGAWWQVGLA